MTSAAPTEAETDELSVARDEIGDGEAVANPRRSFFELHNMIAISYLVVMRGMLYFAAPGAAVADRIDVTLALLLVACAISAVPDETWSRHLHGTWWRRWPGHIYRGMFVVVLAQSYLMLRDLLPLLNPGSLDAELLAIDEAIFGVTPALWLDRFNVRPIIEWFSAFYFSYFLICATFIFGVLWFVRQLKIVRVFAIGGATAFFLGQLIYVAVPGFGPVKYLDHAFTGPLDGGFFWGLVDVTVQQGGAMKDIFPSLHTALPTFLTLFAFYAAKHDRRWRILSRLTAFFTFNIIISTMLLRWHYAIDVVAGLCLAFGSMGFAIWAAPREARIQRKHGLTSHWDWSDAGRERSAETVSSAT
ncbi:MAG: phosphatase PAP2 family protein [Polyangiaceae bacterium]